MIPDIIQDNYFSDNQVIIQNEQLHHFVLYYFSQIIYKVDYGYLKKIEDDLKDITGDLDVSYSSNRYIEFNHQGVNKGQGLKKLADILGVDIKETIAIGDNFNDLSMIKVAGLGVGVQNTVEDMKKECDVITKATNNENAVAEVISKYILGTN